MTLEGGSQNALTQSPGTVGTVTEDDQDISALYQIGSAGAAPTVTITRTGYYTIQVLATNHTDETTGLTGGAYQIVVRNTATNADRELANDPNIQLAAGMSLNRTSRKLLLQSGWTIGVWILGQAGDTNIDLAFTIMEAA